MAEAATDAGADAAEEVTEEQEAATAVVEGEFDPERAMATIKKQRESEAEALAKVKELEERLSAYQSEEEAKAEAEKALEVKVAERDAALKAKDAQIADLHVRYSFIQEATEKGVADPALAYLAAKQEGLLGAYDPKEGKVSGHDFDALGERYASFRVEESAVSKAGDAGARGKGTTMTPGDQFNEAVRQAVRGRR